MGELNITKAEAEALCNHIDMTLIQTIRADPDIDSMSWLRSMVHVYEKLCAHCGYVGITESEEDCEWAKKRGEDET